MTWPHQIFGDSLKEYTTRQAFVIRGKVSRLCTFLLPGRAWIENLRDEIEDVIRILEGAP